MHHALLPDRVHQAAIIWMVITVITVTGLIRLHSACCYSIPNATDACASALRAPVHLSTSHGLRCSSWLLVGSI